MKNAIAIPVIALLAITSAICLNIDITKDVISYRPEPDIDCEQNQSSIAQIISARYLPKKISEINGIMNRNGYILRNIADDYYIYIRVYTPFKCILKMNVIYYFDYSKIIYLNVNKEGVVTSASALLKTQIQPGFDGKKGSNF